ncbi:MAG: sigma-70 family RNA polymerase sigma factor [Clostridia bacterium]|nr:sigma-70 family RNA polymerase sigma factor [Clostridia bacterium]
MTDEFTLRRAQKGDAQAFEQLVTPHEQMLWRVCWHYTRHQEDAADCLQETMLKAWKAIKSYRGDCSLSSWLYRIAATVCLDFLRKQKRLPQTESADEMAEEEGFTPVDSSPTPDEAVIRRESADNIRAAIDSLPGDMRTVIILYALQGLGYEEIAAATQTAVGTVKSRLNRARQKIAKFLAGGNISADTASDQMKGGQPNVRA